MKEHLQIIVSAAALSLLGAMTPQRAFATPELKLDDGLGHSVDIADGSAADHCAAADCLTFIGSLGVWRINVTTGASGAAAAPSLLELNSLDKSIAGIGTLTIMFSDNGLSTPLAGFSLDAGGTITPKGTITFRAFGGNSNTKFDVTQPVGMALSFSPPPTGFSGSTSGLVSGSGPYSLTEIVTISFRRPGSVSFDAALNPVPEPASCVLLGGLILATIGAIRSKARRRLP